MAKPELGKRQFSGGWERKRALATCLCDSPRAASHNLPQRQVCEVFWQHRSGGLITRSLTTSFPPTRFFPGVQIKLTSFWCWFSKQMNFSKHFKGTCQLKPRVGKGMQSSVLMGGKGGVFMSVLKQKSQDPFSYS